MVVEPLHGSGEGKSPTPWLSAMTGSDRFAADEGDPAELLRRVAQRRDEDAFTRLFDDFAPRIKGMFRRVGTNDATAEELAQEAMLTVWRKATLYDPAKASAATWIFCIARNLRIDAIRREKRPEWDPRDPMLQPDAPPSAEVRIEATQQQARLHAAMSTLPPDQAKVIRLAFFEGKAHSEIAVALGLPLGTVKSRVRLAVSHLRASLEDPS
jgi:RNA polymerase sigma-70 factor (ECF subfamily)